MKCSVQEIKIIGRHLFCVSKVLGSTPRSPLAPFRLFRSIKINRIWFLWFAALAALEGSGWSRASVCQGQTFANKQSNSVTQSSKPKVAKCFEKKGCPMFSEKCGPMGQNLITLTICPVDAALTPLRVYAVSCCVSGKQKYFISSTTT